MLSLLHAIRRFLILFLEELFLIFNQMLSIQAFGRRDQLISSANSLDPDQDRHSLGTDLNQNCLTLIVTLKEFVEKLILKKVSRSQQNHEKLTSMQRVNPINSAFITTAADHLIPRGGGGGGDYFLYK